jgi:EmrB/QacA subfamily drug resistance transporter
MVRTKRIAAHTKRERVKHTTEGYEMPATSTRFVLAGCMAMLSMSAIEATIVATAMPTIVTHLQGIEHFGWVFVAYLLPQAITIPLYGRLADLYGRRLPFFIGSTIFLIGSIFCGLANSMLELIVFRVLQGLGAGSLQPLAFTIVGDLYNATERGKVQVHLSIVWAISAVLGPFLGTLIVQESNWSIIFWINVPVGIVSISLIAAFFEESPMPASRSKLNLKGVLLVLLFTGGISSALLGLSDLGWWVFLALVISGVALRQLLSTSQEAGSQPMIPPEFLRNRAVSISNGGALIIGACMMGITVFLPTYLEGVMGSGVEITAVSISALPVSWAIASLIAGRLLLIASYRATALSGGVSIMVGSLSLLALTAYPAPGWAIAASVFMGAGIGMCHTTFIVLAQNSVPPNFRGMATASIVFTRTLGAAFGTALLGCVLNFSLKMTPDEQHAAGILLHSSERVLINTRDLYQLSNFMSSALQHVYITVVLLAVASVGIACAVPAVCARRSEQEEVA